MSCRTIPWLWVTFGFLWHVCAGFVLAYTPWLKAIAIGEAITGAGPWTLAGTGLIALVWTGVLPVVWAVVEAGSGAMPVTKTIAGIGVMVLAGAETWAYALAWSGALALTWAVVEDELPKSLSQFQTFLILALTSLLGMGLGWLVHLLYR
jgi:serine/threonine-protein kinase